MVMCSQCGTEYDRKPRKCQCGYRFSSDDDPGPPQIRRCEVCKITQEDYRRKWQWSNGIGPRPGEQPYPYLTELEVFRGKFFCQEHNPQFIQSMREFAALEAMVAARSKGRAA